MGTLVSDNQQWDAHAQRLREGLAGQKHGDPLATKDFDDFQVSMERLIEDYQAMRVSRYIEVVVPHLDQIKSFEKSITAATQNNMTASLIWSGAQAVIECACRHANHLSATLDQLADFYDSMPILDQFMNIFPTNLRLRYALQEIYGDYVDYCLLTLKYLNRPPLLNTARNIFTSKPQNELGKIRKRYERHRSKFMDAAKLIFIEHQVREKKARLNSTQNSNLPEDAMDEEIQFPVSTLPYEQNKAFHGRGGTLIQLHSYLQAHPAAVGEATSCIVHGMPGIGKTQTVLQYAFEYLASYQCIFWLAAENEVELQRSYNSIADALHLREGRESQANRVRKWLKETDRPWLLIFDNVETHNSIANYWPHNIKSRSSVIMTSRRPDLTHLVQHHIDLPCFESEEGGRLLLKLLAQTSPDRTPGEDDESVATEISSEVGSLPLAIACVSGYISQIRKSLNFFLNLFRRRKKYVLEMDKPVTWYQYEKYQNLATVWDLAFEVLSPGALHLLYLLAFFNGDGIPESLLLGDSLGDVGGVWKERGLILGDTAEYIDLSRKLGEWSLIKVESNASGSCLVMHRSIRDGVLHRLERDLPKRQIIFEQAVATVRRAIPFNHTQGPMPQVWPQTEIALPHLMSLQTIFEDARPSLVGSEDFSRLLADAGIAMHFKGLRGQTLMQTAEWILDNIKYDLMGPLRADIDVIVGIMHGDKGIEKREESLVRRERALRIRRHQYDLAKANNVSVSRDQEILLYNAESDYGCALLQKNHWREAKPLFQKCRAKYPDWGNEDTIPFEYSKYHHHIAFVYMYEGENTLAKENMTEALRLLVKVDPKSSSAYKFQYHLACIESQDGKYDLALEMHEKVLQGRRKDIGEYNVQTLLSYYTVGAMHHKRQELEEAETSIRKSIDLNNEYRVGWPDPFVARAKFHLSRLIRERGLNLNLNEAESLEKESRDILDKLLPLDFPDCLHGLDELFLFDHMMPIFAGRFLYRELLDCVRDAE